jgi:hypothetical protein
VLEKYGLSDIDVFCNKMRFNGRRVELSFPYYDQGCGICGNCKKLHVQKFRDDSRKVIYVGDGLSDRFAARASDVVFAKGELMEYLMANNVEFVRFDNLRDVNRWVNRLLTDDTGLLWADLRSVPTNLSHSEDPCQETTPPKKRDAKRDKKDMIKKLKMKKRVGDMDDARYIVYYDFGL